MRRKINILITQAKDELLDLVSEDQTKNTVKSHHNLWTKVLKVCPSLVGKQCHWHYNGSTQELRIREGYLNHWWFKYTF
jgi:hypothetical protein